MDTIKKSSFLSGPISSDEDKTTISQISAAFMGVRGAVKRFGTKSSDHSNNIDRPRKYRWKMLTRIFLHFIRWEKVRSSGKDRGFVMRRMVAGHVQERVFNVNQFSKNIQQYQILSVHAKLLLYKEPHQRCKNDLVVILGYMNRMTCFNKFPVSTKREIAPKIRYNCYSPGEIIFKEGAHPLYFYFLLSGSVQLYKAVTKPCSPDHEGTPQSLTVNKPHGKPICEGVGFGELAIQNNHARTFTIAAAEPCECFTLEKEDFIKLLGAFHDEERTVKDNVIRNIPQCAGVTEADIKRAIDSSYIKIFTKGEIIVKGEDFYLANSLAKSEHDLGNPSILDTFAHVIVSGAAILEKRIFVNQEPLPCGTTIVRLPKNKLQDKVLDTVTQRVRASVAVEQPELQGRLALPPLPPNAPAPKYISVRTYVPGDIFLPFLNEEEYVIGAMETTTILFLPKTPFILHKSGEVMVSLFDELSNAKIAVDEQIKEYNYERIWRDYRKQLVRQVLVDKLLRRSQT